MEQDRRYIVPKAGATVRNPEMSFLPLPPEGAEVIWSMEWEQSLRFGDISVETDKQREKREAKAESDRRDAIRLQREQEREKKAAGGEVAG